MFSQFFIDRPIFAGVISVFIVIAGWSRRAAAGRAVSRHRAAEGHRQRDLSGRERRDDREDRRRAARAAAHRRRGHALLQLAARSTARSTITVTFEVGTDLDLAAFNVNNRVQLALPRLPEEVRRNGVTVAKRSTDILLVDRARFAGRPLRHAVPVELRDAQHHRRAEAHPGRRPTCSLRRAATRCASGCSPTSSRSSA